MVRYLVSVMVLLVASSASAATINVGTHYLLPNTANQTINISITGTESILTLDFRGETMLGNSGPVFTGVNITGPGTVFAGKTLNYTYGIPGNWFESGASTTVGNEVIANGLLGVLTVSTVGLYSGTFDLSLKHSLPSGNNGTVISGSPPPTLLVTDGQMIIQNIPEPASMFMMAAMMAGGVPAMLVYRRRRKAATPAAVS